MAAPLDPQERYIENKVQLYWQKLGWITRKLQWIGRHGAPDRVFIRSGIILFIEFKQRKKKPTENQRLEHERLREQGMKVYVIDNIEDGKALADSFDRKRNFFRTDDSDLMI